MNAIAIGLSALAAGQKGLALVGQNVANATTPGYRRQALNLVSRTVDGVNGVGVDVARITRYEHQPVRTAILAGNADQASTAARLGVRRQAEATLGSGLGEAVEGFFNQVGQLTTRPDDPAVRRPVLAAAADLARQFTAAAGDLDRLRADTGGQVRQAVAEVNGLAGRIAGLNAQISGVESRGGQAHELRDQRDQLVDDLSQRIDVRVVPQPFGVVNVIATGAAVVLGEFANTFAVDPNPAGNLVVTQQGSAAPLAFAGGTLGGLLREHNQDLPATRGRLDGVARELIRRVNQVQATGLGTGGPITTAVGTTPVANPAAPLSGQNLPFPPQAGRLAVTLTDAATNQRTTAFVTVNPATQSLNAVAAAITAGTGGRVQAAVDPATNTLRLQAQPGTRFDFTGRVPDPPAGPGTGGTSAPQVGGLYTGPADDTYSFQVVGAGTVGTTPGLKVEVRDAANQVISTVDVGAGYTPGTELTLPHGLTVRLSAGTAANGTFSVPAVAEPDGAGLLAALGVNGLFTGTGAATIGVRPEVLADPGLFAAGRTGQPGDSSNLVRLAAVRDQSAVNGQTLSAELDDTASAVGADVAALGDRHLTQAGVLRNLGGQEQEVVGVDTNEELLKLLDYQRLIEGASKYLSVVNSALDEIIGIIR